MHHHNTRNLLSLLCLFFLTAWAQAATNPAAATVSADQNRGQEIIHRFVEVNRYQLVGHGMWYRLARGE